MPLLLYLKVARCARAGAAAVILVNNDAASPHDMFVVSTEGPPPLPAALAVPTVMLSLVRPPLASDAA